jgi:hypothetical protein
MRPQYRVDITSHDELFPIHDGHLLHMHEANVRTETFNNTHDEHSNTGSLLCLVVRECSTLSLINHSKRVSCSKTHQNTPMSHSSYVHSIYLSMQLSGVGLNYILPSTDTGRAWMYY